MKHTPYIANLSSVLEAPPTWHAQAKCRALSPKVLDKLFWPDGQGVSLQEAKSFCWGLDGHPCPVREQCLAEALARPARETREGCHGGASPQELRNLRAGRAATNLLYGCGHSRDMNNSVYVGLKETGKHRLGCRQCHEPAVPTLPCRDCKAPIPQLDRPVYVCPDCKRTKVMARRARALEKARKGVQTGDPTIRHGSTRIVRTGCACDLCTTARRAEADYRKLRYDIQKRKESAA